jgi:hypothetical protein
MRGKPGIWTARQLFRSLGRVAPLALVLTLLTLLTLLPDDPALLSERASRAVRSGRRALPVGSGRVPGRGDGVPLPASVGYR